MTDREIIEHLAERVMGWRVIALALTSGVFDTNPGSTHGVNRSWPKNFNPLESIADAFEVQAAILDGPRATDYVLRIYDSAVKGLTVIGMQKLCRAMLTASARQRCLAAVEATR